MHMQQEEPHSDHLSLQQQDRRKMSSMCQFKLTKEGEGEGDHLQQQ
jgi:hypothetical protein